MNNQEKIDKCKKIKNFGICVPECIDIFKNNEIIKSCLECDYYIKKS